MIHYLLLLRPISIQHEPPPPSLAPSSSTSGLKRQPRYYHSQRLTLREARTGPTKPQQKPHPQQKLQQKLVESTRRSSSDPALARATSTSSHVKSYTGRESGILQCRCLDCAVESPTTATSATRENKQSTDDRESLSYPKRTKGSNLWKALIKRQIHSSESTNVTRITNANDSFRAYEESTPPIFTQEASLRLAEEKLPVTSTAINEVVKKVTPSAISIKASATSGEEKQTFPSLSPRKKLQTFGKLRLTFTLALSRSWRKSRTAVWRKVHHQTKDKVLLENFSTSESEEVEENDLVREEKREGSSLMTRGKRTSFVSEFHKDAFPRNSVISIIPPLSSSSTSATTSSVVSHPELERKAKIVCDSGNVSSFPASPEKHKNQQLEVGNEKKESQGNCRNINNNNTKKGSKNFEQLKKFLLFCKGLRKKSK